MGYKVQIRNKVKEKSNKNEIKKLEWPDRKWSLY